MTRSAQTVFPFQTVVVGGYVFEEQDCDETHYNLSRETDVDFGAILDALRTMLCLRGSTTPSTTNS